MKRLSRTEQKRGMYLMRAGLRINPIGAALTFGYALNILALHYEASEIQTSLLYAGPLVIGFFGMLVPMLFAGIDTTRIMVRFWILRSMVGCIFLLIPFLATNAQKVWLIVGGSYGFLFARIFASTAWPSVCRGFSKTRDDLNYIVAFMTRWWNVGMIVASVFAYVALQNAALFGGIDWAFFALFVLAALCNFSACALFYRMPETGPLEGGKENGIAVAIPLVLKTAAYREVLIQAFLMGIHVVLAGFQLNYLKHVLGFSMSETFIVTLIGFSAAVLSSQFLQSLGTHISFRVLLCASQSIMILLGFSWAFLGVLDSAFLPVVATLLFALLAMMINFHTTLLGTLQADRLPEHLRVPTTVVYQLGTATGAVIGVALVAYLRHVTLASLTIAHQYTSVFIVFTIILLFSLLFSFSMKSNKKIHWWQDFASMAPGNVLALLRAKRLGRRMPVGQSRRVQAYERILTGNTLIQQELHAHSLKSADPYERSAAYRSLKTVPRPESIDLVLAEASDDDSPFQAEAIGALGFLGDTQAEPVLKDCLLHPSGRIRAAALCAQIRLGVAGDEDEILFLYNDLNSAEDAKQVLMAFIDTYQTDLLWKILINDIQANRSPRYLELCVVSLAGSLGVLESCTEILAMDGVAAWREVTDLLPPESGIPEDLGSDIFQRWQSKIQQKYKVKTLPISFSAALFYLQYCSINFHADVS